MAGQEVPGTTTIAVEYSLAYGRSAVGREPYCPIPKPATGARYARYKAEAARSPEPLPGSGASPCSAATT